jgi:hypothetical protein
MAKMLLLHTQNGFTVRWDLGKGMNTTATNGLFADARNAAH